MTALSAQLSHVGVLYEIPDDNIVGEVFVPAMSVAEGVDAGAGFFSSKCLAQLAPGLAAFVNHSDSVIRLLISPALSVEDQEAIARAVSTPQEVLEKSVQILFEDAVISPERMVRHAVDCLAYLLAANRLQLRVVLMPTGQYHKKFWIFRTGDETMAVHGSGNATERGMLVNGEQMSIDVSWSGEASSIRRIKKLADGWNLQWSDNGAHSKTFEISKALAVLKTLEIGPKPTLEQFWEAWQQDSADGAEPPPPPRSTSKQLRRLEIPKWLNWQHGTYAHQAEAITAFESNDRQGLLAIATGGGKTKTALIAATRLQDSSEDPFVLVILVPSSPLEAQWTTEVESFGVTPIIPSSLEPSDRRVRLSELAASISHGVPKTTVIVVTNQLFSSDRSIRDFIDRVAGSATTMLVADEVHNLGAKRFISDPPESFSARLGLSATPIRQYDPDGTDQLLNFFGGLIYEFSIKQAIDSGCLVPYDYHLIEVFLEDDELEEYGKLTKQILQAGFGANDDGRGGYDDSNVTRLLMKRRSILEHARDKISKLRELVEEIGPRSVSRTLIYASAKARPKDAPKQILSVNELLNELNISFHQVTSKETASGQASVYLDRFANGELQVLTAMKVLDEGVDLPQTDTAILLASSSVEREWVQRRGRVLRTAPNKSKAAIYDFLVVPRDLGSNYAGSVLKSELARALAFSDDASNEWLPYGPRTLISKYEQHRFRRETNGE